MTKADIIIFWAKTTTQSGSIYITEAIKFDGEVTVDGKECFFSGVYTRECEGFRVVYDGFDEIEIECGDENLEEIVHNALGEYIEENFDRIYQSETPCNIGDFERKIEMALSCN